MRFLLIGEGTALVHNIALQILDGFPKPNLRPLNNRFIRLYLFFTYTRSPFSIAFSYVAMFSILSSVFTRLCPLFSGMLRPP